MAAAIVLKLTSAIGSCFDISGLAPAVGTAIFLAVHRHGRALGDAFVVVQPRAGIEVLVEASLASAA